MSLLLIAGSRLPAAARAAVAAAVLSRAMSAQGIVAAEKLRNALEEYRLQNYDREVPSRFKKDILKAATVRGSSPAGGGGSGSADSVVVMDGLQRVLHNIHMENRLTQQEMQALFEELGNGKEIPAKSIIKFI